jgi:hypothetical protein
MQEKTNKPRRKYILQEKNVKLAKHGIFDPRARPP